MADFVHTDDKTDLNRAFFQAVATGRSHAFVNLRLSTAPDDEGNAVYINRTEHQFLQFYPNGRLAAVTIIEDTEPLRGLLSRSMKLPPRQLAAQQANALAALLGPTASTLSSAVGVPNPASPGHLAEHVRRLVQRMAPNDKLAQWMMDYVFNTEKQPASLNGSSSSSTTSDSPHSPRLPAGMRYLVRPPSDPAQSRVSSASTPMASNPTSSSSYTALPPICTAPPVSGATSAWQSAAAALRPPASRCDTATSADDGLRGTTPSTCPMVRSHSWELAGVDCDADSTGAVRGEEAFGAHGDDIHPLRSHAPPAAGQARHFPEMTATLWHTLTPFQQVLAHSWGASAAAAHAGRGGEGASGGAAVRK